MKTKTPVSTLMERPWSRTYGEGQMVTGQIVEGQILSVFNQAGQRGKMSISVRCYCSTYTVIKANRHLRKSYNFPLKKSLVDMENIMKSPTGIFPKGNT
jgi:hypothetical protein